MKLQTRLILPIAIATCIRVWACSELAMPMHTRMGTNTHMGETRISRDTCMGSPYVYRQPIRVWAKYVYGTCFMLVSRN